MRRYSVGVEVIRAYVVEVNANTAEEAIQKVEEFPPHHIDAVGEYVDTTCLVEDTAELKEE